MKFHPSLRSWRFIFDPSLQALQPFAFNIHENNQLTCFRRFHAGSARANFRPQGARSGLKRALPRIERGRSKVKWAKKLLILIFGSGRTRPGGPSMANFTPVARALSALLRIKTFCPKD